MPSFFVPHAKDHAQAERVWTATREFMQQQGFSPTSRRIFAIAHEHKGKPRTTSVGELDPYEMEEVLVLLETESVYLCCTANRGVLRGGPILIGRGHNATATDFDGEIPEPP